MNGIIKINYLVARITDWNTKPFFLDSSQKKDIENKINFVLTKTKLYGS